jgi:hypothetical protein
VQNKNSRFKGFIFDLDGTLVDSALDFKAIRADLGLEAGAPILESVSKWHEKKRLEAYNTIGQHELKGAHASSLIPGVIQFLDRLKLQNKPLAVFTRNSRPVTELTLLKHNLQFSIVMTRDEAPAKPDPTALHFIIKKWGFKNHEVLFVGDYLYDLQAGLAAQVPTALFLNTPPDFDTSGATFCFSSYSELEQNFLDSGDTHK